MASLGDRIVGYSVIFGGTFFVIALAVSPAFRDYLYKLFMGTGKAKFAHITNQG